MLPDRHGMLADLFHDVRLALRRIRRAPGVTLLIVATLGIGLGANFTMAGAIDRLLFQAPPHIEQPSRVVRLLLRTREPNGALRIGSSMSHPAYLELEEAIPEFERAAGSVPFPTTFGNASDAVQARALAVTGDYFRVFGARPVIGRFFDASDGFPRGAPGGPALVVLEHGFWQRHFGADRSVVGKSIRVGNLDYTVVGIAPDGFRGVQTMTPDFWLPLAVALPAAGQPAILDDRGGAAISVVARLRSQASRNAVQEKATTVWRQRNAANERVVGRTEVLLSSAIVGRGADQPREVRIAVWLGTLSVVVLIIACVNVTNLLIGMAHARRRDVAVRLALGASAGRVGRYLLTEALLFAVFGGAAAILLAAVAGTLLSNVSLAGLPPLDGGLIDGRLLVFACFVVIGTGGAVSLLPLRHVRSVDLNAWLQTGSAGAGQRSSRGRLLLVTAQSALCVLLLVVAALFTQSLRRVQAIDLGVDVERTYVANFDLRDLVLPAAELNTIFIHLVERVRRIPAVTRASLAEIDPYAGGGRAVAIHTAAKNREELFRAQLDAGEIVIETAVDSGFFRTVGAALRGRDFDDRDRPGSQRVAILNGPLAALLFPIGDPIGQCVYLPVIGGMSSPSGPCFTVVGVLEGFWSRSITDRTQFLVYVPIAQRPSPIRSPGALFVRSAADPTVILGAIRAAMTTVRPELASAKVQRLADVIEPQIRPWRIAATLFSVFGTIAVLIAAIGLYGVVSHATAQRTVEIAVRRALGARAHHIASTVVAEGLVAVLIGIALGVLVTLIIGPSVGPLLFGTAPDDPYIVTGVAALMLGVGVLALVAPTVRAMRSPPAAVLRSD